MFAIMLNPCLKSFQIVKIMLDVGILFFLLWNIMQKWQFPSSNDYFLCTKPYCSKCVAPIDGSFARYNDFIKETNSILGINMSYKSHFNC
jgi:hypothetical protein